MDGVPANGEKAPLEPPMDKRQVQIAHCTDIIICTPLISVTYVGFRPAAKMPSPSCYRYSVQLTKRSGGDSDSEASEVEESEGSDEDDQEMPVMENVSHTDLL